ncbi:MAG: hypothetical protein K2R98_14600 [Gemmataceae bacterium]|nr:hypothetical protein [Gemmataceae bacterium]
MIDFCIHCGRNIGNAPSPNGIITCQTCGKSFKLAPAAPKQMIDANEDLIRRGVAARCSLCQQVVEVKGTGAKAFVPHFLKGERKMCRNSGKPIT